ncbi:MAG: PadR family transcriptional regulator [Bacteroides sp. SM23_62_1]|nr:MAG: PadR family transcriptional regulator [Bacteroides sp. SM23_62_1]
MISKELIKGTLRSIILRLLLQHERMYGYEITREVSELTGGKINLTFAALYPVLHKLEADGYVVTETENVSNRIRKYYALTTDGKKESARKVEEFHEFLKTMEHLFKPVGR